MSYAEFKSEYIKTFKAMMCYSPDQSGAGIFAEKMADLEEAHPEWAAKVELEE